MKKFIHTIRGLGERAAELQEALQQVPPKVAEIREAVTMTTDQLQQMQADIARNVTDLKADGQDRLVEALREVNGSTGVFRDAGYELGQVEMELSPVPRMMVHLNRMEDVRHSTLRSLAAANKELKITHALLTAVMQAEAMAEQVDIQDQVYYRLSVHIGPVPVIRLCWMPDVSMAESAPTTQTPTATEAIPVEEGASSAYEDSSFFKNRSKTMQSDSQHESVTAVGQSESATSATPVQTSPQPAVVPTTPTPTARRHTGYRTGVKDWGASSLERFKKMPSISKY